MTKMTDEIKALEAPVKAESHAPVYKMHRYFARRPWNVFEHIIGNYTRPGEIILDPFCGGGVTAVEGLKLRRKVVAVDLNPVAAYITRMEVTPVDLDKLDEAFKRVEAAVRDQINTLYQTKCRSCGSENAIVQWYQWSNVFSCSACNANVVAGLAKKLHGGTYQCPDCGSKVNASSSKRLEDQLIRLNYVCPDCNKTGEAEADENDIALALTIEQNFESIVRKERLWYPKDAVPDCDRQYDDALQEKGFTHFYKMFTTRNLLANAKLFKAVGKVKADAVVREMLKFCFSSRLAWTSIMVSSTTHGWQHHGFWMPNVHYEMSVWKMFHQGYEKGQSTIRKGKEQSNKDIGEYCVFADKSDDFKNNATCFILNQSSHELPLPNNSIDAVITDPPFGGNVQYSELSNFWWVWFDKGLIDNTYEAVESRHTGFASAKSHEHYEDMLYRVFNECHRVLKKDGWMTMTFHNRELRVWMSLHRAARRAGFRLPSAEECHNRGIVYQPPIEHYTTTLHQRSKGSMLGDFILSFKREEKVLEVGGVLSKLTTEQETDLKEKVENFLKYQGGADENAMMTCLIPYLGEMGLLHRIGGHNFTEFLRKYFYYDKKESKWYSHDQIQLSPDHKSYVVRPMDYIPAEVMVEQLIQSYFKEHRRATMDEVLNLIYTQLVNSFRPGMQIVEKVLERLCDLQKIPNKSEYFFALKAEKNSKINAKDNAYIQTGIFGDISNLSHNELIEVLCKYASELGYSVHIGETEQKKVAKFGELSIPMLDNVRYGIPKNAFRRIKEIDLLYLKGDAICAAFEVTTSIGTAGSAINDRYRNLFAALPNFNIRCFVVIRDEDFQKAYQILNSDANIKDGVAKKVQLLKISDMTQMNIEKFLIENN